MTAATPDLTGALSETDVVLVTGSTDGIGREIARNVAATGATVLVHGRDREKGQRTVADLPGDGHAFYRADFADFEAVRDFAARVREDHDRLDVLVNNAGTWQSERRLTAVPGGEAVEFTFLVNHLAPFLLTNLLVDRLDATGQSRREHAAGESDGSPNPARVVTVSSEVHRRATMDLDAVQGADGPSGVEAYGLSKLANVVFTSELSRRLPDGVTANCCHPGVSPTTALDREGSLLAGLGWRIYGLLGRVVDITDSPTEAAETPTYLAGSPAVADVSGKYFEDCERTRPSDAATDRTAQRRLWERSAEWVGLEEAERERLAA